VLRCVCGAVLGWPVLGALISTPASLGLRGGGRQGLRYASPLAPIAWLLDDRAHRVTEIITDKGWQGRARLRRPRCRVDGHERRKKIAQVTQTTVCRGDGGFGGPALRAPAVYPDPARWYARIVSFCDRGTLSDVSVDLYRSLRRRTSADPHVHARDTLASKSAR